MDQDSEFGHSQNIGHGCWHRPIVATGPASSALSQGEGACPRCCVLVTWDLPEICTAHLILQRLNTDSPFLKGYWELLQKNSSISFAILGAILANQRKGCRVDLETSMLSSGG